VLRILLEHRGLVSDVVAAGVWCFGHLRVPFPATNDMLVLIAANAPHIHAAIRVAFTVLRWFASAPSRKRSSTRPATPSCGTTTSSSAAARAPARPRCSTPSPPSSPTTAASSSLRTRRSVGVRALSERTHQPADFRTLRELPQRDSGQRPLSAPRRISAGHVSQSERDWAYTKRELWRGRDPSAVADAIADFRKGEESDPRYHAERTVQRAGEALAAEGRSRGSGTGPLSTLERVALRSAYRWSIAIARRGLLDAAGPAAAPLCRSG